MNFSHHLFSYRLLSAVLAIAVIVPIPVRAKNDVGPGASSKLAGSTGAQVQETPPKFPTQKCSHRASSENLHRPCFLIKGLGELEPAYKPLKDGVRRIVINDQTFEVPLTFTSLGPEQIVQLGAGKPLESIRLLARLVPYTVNARGQSYHAMLDAQQHFETTFPYGIWILLSRNEVNEYEATMDKTFGRPVDGWSMLPQPYGLDDYYAPPPKEGKPMRQWKIHRHF